VPFPYARMSTASLSICSSVKPGLRLIIFKSCIGVSVNRSSGGGRASGQTNSVGDAVGEADELDLVAGALPVREKGQNEAESSRLGVGRAVGEWDVSQSVGAVGAVGGLAGTHGGENRGRRTVTMQSGGLEGFQFSVALGPQQC
jgi:hypothetical protein